MTAPRRAARASDSQTVGTVVRPTDQGLSPSDPYGRGMTESVPEGETAARPIDVEPGEVLRDLIESNDRVLVEFYTANCGICDSVEPIVGLAARETDALVVTVNPGFDLDAVETYDVRSVPTFVLFEDGEEVDRLADGFVETERLVEFARGRGE